MTREDRAATMIEPLDFPAPYEDKTNGSNRDSDFSSRRLRSMSDASDASRESFLDGMSNRGSFSFKAKVNKEAHLRS